MRRCLSLCLLLGLTPSCVTLGGRPSMRSGLFWRDEPLGQVIDQGSRDLWLRVRGGREEQGRALRRQLRRMLLEEGWRLVSGRREARLWVDIELRYWGTNPFGDEGQASWRRVLHGDGSRRVAAGRSATNPGLLGGLVARPSAALLAAVRGVEREYDVVLDLQLRRPGGDERRCSLVAWVKRVDLDEAEAALALARVLREGLRRSFARPQSSRP